MEAVTADAADEDSKHDIGGNIIPMLVAARRGRRLRLRRQRGPGRDGPRPQLLARRRHARRLLRRAHGPHLGRARSSTSTTSAWPIHTWPDPLPPAKFVFDDEGRRGHARRLHDLRRRHHLRRGRAPLDPLPGRARCTPTRRSRTPSSCTASDIGRSAVVRRAILDKNVTVAPGRADRRRPRGRPRALHRLGERHRGHPQGRAGGGADDARRTAHPRVPAGRLRRRRRARGVPRPRARRARGRHRPQWGARRRRGRPAAVVGHEAWDALAARRRTSRRCGRSPSTSPWPPAVEGADVVHSPHLVREPRRPSRQAALRHPARRDRAQPRAAAAVEGRAARRRLRAVDRSASARRSRTPTPSIAVSRGMREDILACYPGRRPRARARDLQRHRHRGVHARPAARTCSSATASTPAGRPSCSSGASPARRASSTCSRRRAPSTPPRSSCCAPARRTRPSSAPRSRGASTSCRRERDGVLWIDEMLPKPDVIQLLSHATVFACPSIYEPLGIVNLEAMACEAAVVATATGGIVEVVVDGETGLLVPFEPSDDGLRTPVDPRGFAAGDRRARERARARPGARGGDGQGRAGSACSSTSPGRRSPSRPRRSTGRSPESHSRTLLYSENSMSASKWKPPSPGSPSWPGS